MKLSELASQLKESDFTIDSVDALWGTVTVDGYQKGEWSFELDQDNPGYVMVYKNKFYSATYEEPSMVDMLPVQEESMPLPVAIKIVREGILADVGNAQLELAEKL